MSDFHPRQPARIYDYETDGQAIYRASFATIRAEMSELPTQMLADFAGMGLHNTVVRIAHAAGDVHAINDIAASADFALTATTALQTGALILTDSQMLAQGITRRRLPADNEVRCLLRSPQTVELAARWQTTRSAAAVSLWEPILAGAVVAIGNAPTALFHLLEMIAAGAPKPAAIIGMPVGFIGAAESKEALAQNPYGVPWLTVHGRRGGSAMAAAALNALAQKEELA